MPQQGNRDWLTWQEVGAQSQAQRNQQDNASSYDRMVRMLQQQGLVTPPATQPQTPPIRQEEATVPVSYLNIDKYLARKPRNRVARVGVELEGAWVTLPTLPPGIEFTGDGSVFPNGAPPGCTKRGELPIGPYIPMALPLALKKFYPAKVDDTCGMHVHMSFDTVLHYNALCDSAAYQETVIEYMNRWAKEESLPASHPIWNRLKGDNRYCVKKFWPASQMFQKTKSFGQNNEGHRYTAVHYCWERKRTVECRLLPMMDNPQLAWRAIKRLIEVTNAYLLATVSVKGTIKVKEKGSISRVGVGETKIKLTLKKGEVYEESIEDIG